MLIHTVSLPVIPAPSWLLSEAQTQGQKYTFIEEKLSKPNQRDFHFNMISLGSSDSKHYSLKLYALAREDVSLDQV